MRRRCRRVRSPGTAWTRARSASSRTTAGTRSRPRRPSAAPVRNFGLGLVGYTWEENGPALAVRRGEARLEEAVEALARLPFVDVLYIRCDWRDVQSRAGAARPRAGVGGDLRRRPPPRPARRLPRPALEPRDPARRASRCPTSCKPKVPLVTLCAGAARARAQARRAALRPSRVPARLRASSWTSWPRRRTANPLVEFADLMMYGFWGEGHTSDWESPFPDRADRRAHVPGHDAAADGGLEAPAAGRQHAARHQPDAATRPCWTRPSAADAGCARTASSWTSRSRSSSSPGRPPWLAVVMEDGYHRHYRTDAPKLHAWTPPASSVIEHAIRHCLDLGANYWSLWTEAENLARYHERHPAGFAALQQRLGYRVRPSWVWQRKRDGGTRAGGGLRERRGGGRARRTLRVVAETADGSRARGRRARRRPSLRRQAAAGLAARCRARSRAAPCACARRSRPRACAGRCAGLAPSRSRRTVRSPSACWPRTTPGGGRESDATARRRAMLVRRLTFTALLATAGALAAQDAPPPETFTVLDDPAPARSAHHTVPARAARPRLEPGRRAPRERSRRSGPKPTSSPCAGSCGPACSTSSAAFRPRRRR